MKIAHIISLIQFQDTNILFCMHVAFWNACFEIKRNLYFKQTWIGCAGHSVDPDQTVTGETL